VHIIRLADLETVVRLKHSHSGLHQGYGLAKYFDVALAVALPGLLPRAVW
jgi:hypothetical protein